MQRKLRDSCQMLPGLATQYTGFRVPCVLFVLSICIDNKACSFYQNMGNLFAVYQTAIVVILSRQRGKICRCAGVVQILGMDSNTPRPTPSYTKKGENQVILIVFNFFLLIFWISGVYVKVNLGDQNPEVGTFRRPALATLARRTRWPLSSNHGAERMTFIKDNMRDI